MKKPACEAVRREAEEDWGRSTAMSRESPGCPETPWSPFLTGRRGGSPLAAPRRIRASIYSGSQRTEAFAAEAHQEIVRLTPILGALVVRVTPPVVSEARRPIAPPEIRPANERRHPSVIAAALVTATPPVSVDMAPIRKNKTRNSRQAMA